MRIKKRCLFYGSIRILNLIDISICDINFVNFRVLRIYVVFYADYDIKKTASKGRFIMYEILYDT